MSGRTPSEAASAYVDGLNAALACVAGGRLLMQGGRYDIRLGREYRVSPDDVDEADGFVRLRTTHRHPLWLEVSLRFSVIEIGEPSAPYVIEPAAYSYVFAAESEV